jgi:hypothetical protein
VIILQCNPVAAFAFRFYGGVVKKLHILPLILISTLCGCADRSGQFPSLKPRAIETAGVESVEEPAAQQIALPVSDPKRVAAINAALAMARKGQSPFESALNAATALTRRGAGSAKGTDAWVAAQLAIGRAESLRSPVKLALSALDDQSFDIMFANPTQDQALFTEAFATVRAMDEQQQAAIDRLTAMLGR